MYHEGTKLCKLNTVMCSTFGAAGQGTDYLCAETCADGERGCEEEMATSGIALPRVKQIDV